MTEGEFIARMVTVFSAIVFFFVLLWQADRRHRAIQRESDDRTRAHMTEYLAESARLSSEAQARFDARMKAHEEEFARYEAEAAARWEDITRQMREEGIDVSDSDAAEDEPIPVHPAG